MRAPELRRQVTVVGQCPLDLHEDVASRISKHRSYAAQPPLALEDETSVADDDVTRSAGRPEAFSSTRRRTNRRPGSSDVTSFRSEPGWEGGKYTMPSHVPLTELTSETATGVTGPMLAQPTSETENPTITVTARTLQTSRRLLGVIGPPVRRRHRRRPTQTGRLRNWRLAVRSSSPRSASCSELDAGTGRAGFRKKSRRKPASVSKRPSMRSTSR